MWATSSAQTDWREAVHAWMIAEDMEESDGEETMEWLEERATNKINLNQTTYEELAELPFLTTQQVEGMIDYISHYYPIRTLNELTMIAALDQQMRELLRHFVYVGEEKAKSVWPAWSEMAAYGRHTLTATGKIPFYERAGDRNGYLGYPYRHDVRYQYNYENQVKVGLTAAQDAGEPFFSDKNRMGYDHYSYYLQLRHIGRLEELNLGMYRVQMGMGLIMNTGFQLGKLAILQSLGRSTHALTAHSSRSSGNYLQGAAATISLSKEWRMTAFASYRPVDATLNDDGTIRTLLYNGYHRTTAEMEKKNNTHRSDGGASIGWRRGTLYIHANMVLTHFNRQLKPQKAAAYRQYAAEGNNFLNSSIDYGYSYQRWSIAGETAINKQGAFALIHTVSVQPDETLSLMLLHRYYDKQYTAIHARSFGEGSHTQNEHGIYMGGTWNASRYWTIQGYADYAHFAWPRYRVSTSSDAFDGMMSTTYHRRRWTLSGRYRMHIRQQDNDSEQRIVNRTDHRMRLRAEYRLAEPLRLSTQVDGVISRKERVSSKGVMIGEHIRWQHQWLQVNGNIAWFHTDDYDSRLYQYEHSVQNDFSFPPYHGHGLRYALTAQAAIKKKIMVTAKIGVTNYFDRHTIGSGLQEINHSSQTDLLIQLRYFIKS